MCRGGERNSEDHAVMNMYGQRPDCLQGDNWSKPLVFDLMNHRLIIETYTDPIIFPPVPFSVLRCTPDNREGSNRRPS